MYEQMERLSLVEMAVWKAFCMLRAARAIMVNTKIMTLEDYILFGAAHRSPSWKEYKTEMRKSNVLPFLELEQPRGV
jgi:hypothetical protein